MLAMTMNNMIVMIVLTTVLLVCVGGIQAW